METTNNSSNISIEPIYKFIPLNYNLIKKIINACDISFHTIIKNTIYLKNLKNL